MAYEEPYFEEECDDEIMPVSLKFKYFQRLKTSKPNVDCYKLVFEDFNNRKYYVKFLESGIRAFLKQVMTENKTNKQGCL